MMHVMYNHILNNKFFTFLFYPNKKKKKIESGKK